MDTQDELIDAMRKFIEWAEGEWDEPTEEERVRALEI